MTDLLLEILKNYGLKEIVGKEHNPEIIKMFAELGYDQIKDDETAWCSALLNYFCMKLGYERSGKLTARSWLNVGEVIEEPEMGDIVIFWRNNPNSWEGHVAVYISKDKDLKIVYSLGGNQGNMLSIKPYHESRVLGYRRLKKI
jgi:uncharacterized protein (TIGR02594 family)